MSQSSSHSRFGAHASLLAVAGFIALSLWARYTPADAQEVDKKKDPAPKAKLKPAKKATTPVAPPVDVTGGKKMEAKELAGLIDKLVNDQMKAEGLPASPKTSDSEFVRRVYLDIVGVIPSSEKVRAFLADKNPNKREALVTDLLKDDRFGRYHAEQWVNLMVPRESNNRALKSEPLKEWLAKHFHDNVPLNKTIFDLVTATGTQEENGAVTFFVGNPTVDKMTDNVSRMFLGVQLQCAQCHNHPFVDWKQTEYWAMAAFFMKTKLTATPQAAAKKGTSPGIAETSAPAKGKKGNLPESAKFVPAKFLQGVEPKLDPKEPYRPVLAKWMTSPENPYFARAMVNRWWHTLFGRGLVNPVDDMHEENEASHPALLTALTEQFKAHDFDLHYLVTAICLSDAYQRSSIPDEANKDDNKMVSHRLVRVLTPEQLFDSLAEVVGKAARDGPRVREKTATKKGPVGPRDNFLNFFRVDEGMDPLEYQAGIPQALRIMNSAATNNFTAAVARATADTKEPAKVIENLFVLAYSRMPTEDETRRLTAYVARQSTPATAYGDVLWSLVNSSEFMLNH